MDDIQVLVATMNQQDTSLVTKMNIRCSSIIANQADREEILEEDGPYGTVKMLTTLTRGVGLNRNIALLASEKEILLFADDDVVYYDDMPQQVLQAFADYPQADVILFGMDIVRNGKIIERRCTKSRRRHVWNAMRFGTYRIAIRREAYLKCNLSFYQLFGGGCMFSMGEDTLFLKACFDNGLQVYSHSYVLGTCSKDSSSWFIGCGEKYFYDKGVLLRYAFPRIYWLMIPYFAIHFKRETELSVACRLRLMTQGAANAMHLRHYSKK